jgi:putative Mg2+ transporter-C (MgtC) family protein
MLVPQFFHFSQIEQQVLSTATAGRLLAACLLGGTIGLERELRH